MKENFEHQTIYCEKIEQTLAIALREFGAYRFDQMMTSVLRKFADGEYGDEAANAICYVYESLTVSYFSAALKDCPERVEAHLALVRNLMYEYKNN